MEKYSNCCGALLLMSPEDPICAECLEHCEAMTQEEMDAEIGEMEWKAKFEE